MGEQLGASQRNVERLLTELERRRIIMRNKRQLFLFEPEQLLRLLH